jgi:hypothetical protein
MLAIYRETRHLNKMVDFVTIEYERGAGVVAVPITGKGSMCGMASRTTAFTEI